jgi:arylsulfatase A-like enzyme
MNKVNPFFPLVALLAASLPLTAVTAAASEQRPNIIIVFTDDQGYTDLGIHGIDPDVRTPNLDQLARDGVLFIDGYATAPQCIPSRAGLITARHQNAFGLDDNLKGPLPHEETTIAQRLRAVGYVTGMVGKWHLEIGRDAKNRPQFREDSLPHAHGFDEMFSGYMERYHATFDLQGNDLKNRSKSSSRRDTAWISRRTPRSLSWTGALATTVRSSSTWATTPRTRPCRIPPNTCSAWRTSKNSSAAWDWPPSWRWMTAWGESARSSKTWETKRPQRK